MKQIATVTLNPAFDLHYQMESFEAEKENYVQSIVCNAGGKGINISRALRANGAESTAYVLLGKENAAAFEAALLRDVIAYVPLYTEGRIRENITLHPAKGKETRISLDTFCASEALLASLEDMLIGRLQAGDLLAFAGRVPCGMEKTAVIRFLKRQAERGVRLVVDSNSLTSEELSSIHPWFIKPNEQELSSFLEGTVSTLNEAAVAAEDMVKKGIAEEVMVSLGGDGAAWSNGSECRILQVPRLEAPLSTVGAGDSTLAGILLASAQGLSTDQALRLGVSFGTAACMTQGTLPPRSADVEQVSLQVRISPV